MAFERLEEAKTLFAGSCLSHNTATMQGIALARRRLRLGVGTEFCYGKRRGALAMGVESQHPCWALMDESGPCMTMTVDTTFMAFGLSEPPFEIEVVMGKIWIVPCALT